MKFGIGVSLATLAVLAPREIAPPALRSWFSPAATVQMSPLQRVGWGAALCGYLGPIGRSPVLSGPDAAKYQWQESTTSAVAGGTITNQGRGLAPKNGTGAFGSPWINPAETSHNLTLTDPATGQSCTVTISLAWSYEDPDSGAVYPASNAMIVASDKELGPSGNGALSYLTRTVDAGPAVILRDGVTFYPGNPTFAGTSNLAADPGFLSGPRDEELVTGGTALHGTALEDTFQQGGRRVKGKAGNYILITPETPFGAEIRNLRYQQSGTRFLYCHFTSDGGATFLIQNANHLSINSCMFTGNYGDSTGIGVYGGSNPTVDLEVVNCCFRNLAQGFYPAPWLGLYIRNCVFHDINNDYIQMYLRTDGAGLPEGWTLDGVISDNIMFRMRNANVGAHPDAVQYYLVGSANTGVAFPGTLKFERNVIALVGSQGLFSGGGQLAGGLTNVLIQNNIIWSRFSNQITVGNSASAVVQFNTALWDIGDPYPGTTANGLLGATSNLADAVDITMRDNISNGYQNTFGNSGITLVENNQTIGRTLAATQAALSAYPPGGINSVLQDKFSIDDLMGAVAAACTPKNVALAAGGAVKPDGSIVGALKLDGSWNS